jgi:hypothetical protein
MKTAFTVDRGDGLCYLDDPLRFLRGDDLTGPPFKTVLPVQPPELIQVFRFLVGYLKGIFVIFLPPIGAAVGARSGPGLRAPVKLTGVIFGVEIPPISITKFLTPYTHDGSFR